MQEEQILVKQKYLYYYSSLLISTMLMTLSRKRNIASLVLGESGGSQEKVKFSTGSPASESLESATGISIPSGLPITTSDVEIKKSSSARVEYYVVVSYQMWALTYAVLFQEYHSVVVWHFLCLWCCQDWEPSVWACMQCCSRWDGILDSPNQALHVIIIMSLLVYTYNYYYFLLTWQKTK